MAYSTSKDTNELFMHKHLIRKHEIPKVTRRNSENMILKKVLLY